MVKIIEAIAESGDNDTREWCLVKQKVSNLFHFNDDDDYNDHHNLMMTTWN